MKPPVGRPQGPKVSPAPVASRVDEVPAVRPDKMLAPQQLATLRQLLRRLASATEEERSGEPKQASLLQVPNPGPNPNPTPTPTAKPMPSPKPKEPSLEQDLSTVAKLAMGGGAAHREREPDTLSSKVADARMKTTRKGGRIAPSACKPEATSACSKAEGGTKAGSEPPADKPPADAESKADTPPSDASGKAGRTKGKAAQSKSASSGRAAKKAKGAGGSKQAGPAPKLDTDAATSKESAAQKEALASIFEGI